MITFERTSAVWNDEPGDEVDQAFRGYFKSALPNPWPQFTPPRAVKAPAAVVERPTRSSRWQLYSRLLLIAASIGLFLGAQFLLPNMVATSNKTNSGETTISNPDNGTADIRFNESLIKDGITIDAYPDPGSK
jgi:hypothetical protein